MSVAAIEAPLLAATRSGQSASGFLYHWVYDQRMPTWNNGEREFFEGLRRRYAKKRRPHYEPWQFELATYPFRPDFWVPDGPLFEVTFLDRGISRLETALGLDPLGGTSAQVRELRILRERWERKLRKIRETRELHGIEVQLVTFVRWHEVVHDDDAFDELIAA